MGRPDPLLTFRGAVAQDPAIDRWLETRPPELAALAADWFQVMRRCGADVRELMHDGLATVCVHDAPFASVGSYTAHVSVGFFHGAFLPDPAGLLRGTGKHMRHVRLQPGQAVDSAALEALIHAAYRDILRRLAGTAP
jgi:hypothetical protein